MINALESSSLRPYLIRALYEWCTDNGFTPYLAVQVDENVQVPREYVKNGEIVLNVSYDATSSLKLGNEFIEFKARFAGTARDIIVPVGRVVAIYARENGQGMAFPPVIAEQATTANAQPAAPAAEEARVMQLVADEADTAPDDASTADEGADGEPPRPGGPGGRPALKRVK
ncbi:ClpXP protease specificity-enhancing factor [Xenophilus arseniciresistens]|uniref:ClpXP protease specificity-enhancing factor n=1 Tax=Xenophilus arseniciresistens TaxID=1283306 RepID=A0AAE3SYF9_9BURK|nr:ClpXP protease specificity-enhancing factor [Xenophilus arseniciresistens]MDA7415460.1 ClpXP protease specificity-enhancing factor [Xenophilus arseniciresistens]